MDFSIFNTLKMGILVLTAASASYLQAVQQEASITFDETANLIEQDFSAGIGLIPRWAKEKLRRECFATRPVVESINDWQVNAIYLKAGIESIAKEYSDNNELQVINENLARNASNINDFVQRFADHDCRSSFSSFEELDYLLSQQNAYLLDYTAAYLDGDSGLQESLLQLLVDTNNDIYLFFIRTLFKRNEPLPKPDELQIALTAYLNSLIVEAQAFVQAIDPPFETHDFVPAYDAYRLSLDTAEEVGRLVGKALAFP